MTYPSTPILPELKFFSPPLPETHTPFLPMEIPKTPLPQMDSSTARLPLSALKGRFSYKPPAEKPAAKKPAAEKPAAKKPPKKRQLDFLPFAPSAPKRKYCLKKPRSNLKNFCPSFPRGNLTASNVFPAGVFFQRGLLEETELKRVEAIIRLVTEKGGFSTMNIPEPDDKLEKLLIYLLRNLLPFPALDSHLSEHFVRLTLSLLKRRAISPHFSTDLAMFMVLPHSQHVFDENFWRNLEPLERLLTFIYLDERDKQQLIDFPILCLVFFKEFYTYLSAARFSTFNFEPLYRLTLAYVVEHPSQTEQILKSNLFLFLHANLMARGPCKPFLES